MFGKIKDKLIRNFCIRTWRVWETLGVHLSPNHFYWPTPDTKDVLKYDFRKEFSLDGIRLNDSAMRTLLEKISRYKNEYAPLHTDSAYASNGDGAILYGMVRELKPAHIIEVGSGFSTQISREALKQNTKETGQHGKITAIEPYPKPILKKLVQEGNHITLIQKKVEEVEMQLFETLQNGDILFIDSSHVVKIGNDVHYLYLSVLPKVPVGTIIHIHDIRFPLDYPREWVLRAKKFWTEQYLLHMFLAFNDSFEILFAGNYMRHRYPELMSSSLVGLHSDGNGWPGCFWIRRIK